MGIKHSRPVPPFMRYCSAIIPSMFDDSLSYYEALCALNNFIQNNLVKVINNNATVTEEYIKLANDLKEYVENYFDNLDVQEEINNKLDAMCEDGTLQSLIYGAINVPQGMTLDLRRIGRKIFYAEDYPFNMQGGCRIDDNYVAYALWDSVTKYPVSNRVVIMNINTGEIIRYADYSFGWCNAIAYRDGKLYIAERGKEINAEGDTQNNGIIHVLNVDTLAVADTITMSFNVNAITSDGTNFFLLQEGTNTVYKYDATLTTLEDTITLDIDYVNYHQTICVDSQYIYLLSTRPSNALNIFDVETGARIRSYNISKYGGLYRVGELQWIDKIDDNGNMIITSDLVTHHENIAQFFVINYKKNVDTKFFSDTYALTLYCDSTTDYYDADGSQAKPFKSANEAINVSINNIVLNGQNKSYKYAYASDIHHLRILNATFSEGLQLQYGDYELIGCTVNDNVVRGNNDCGLYIRRGNFFIDQTTFDVTTDYCISDGGQSIVKIVLPTFTGYTTSVFKGNISNSEVFLNNGNNMPYIPRAYGTRFKLSPDYSMNAYAVGTYPWNTTLSEDEIQNIISSCNRIELVTQNLSDGHVEFVSLVNKQGSAGEYSLTRTVISTGSVNQRIAKCIFKVRKTGLEITNCACQTFDGTTAQMVESPAQIQLITIKGVNFYNER